MLSCDCGCNLFQCPDVFIFVLETLDSVYGCYQFPFLLGLLFKQLSLVVWFVFEVTNYFSYRRSWNIVLDGSRLMSKVVHLHCFKHFFHFLYRKFCKSSALSFGGNDVCIKFVRSNCCALLVWWAYVFSRELFLLLTFFTLIILFLLQLTKHGLTFFCNLFAKFRC